MPVVGSNRKYLGQHDKLPGMYYWIHLPSVALTDHNLLVYIILFIESAPRTIQSLNCNVCVCVSLFVCLFIPSCETRNRVDWKLLIKDLLDLIFLKGFGINRLIPQEI